MFGDNVPEYIVRGGGWRSKGKREAGVYLCVCVCVCLCVRKCSIWFVKNHKTIITQITKYVYYVIQHIFFKTQNWSGEVRMGESEISGCCKVLKSICPLICCTFCSLLSALCSLLSALLFSVFAFACARLMCVKSTICSS